MNNIISLPSLQQFTIPVRRFVENHPYIAFGSFFAAVGAVAGITRHMMQPHSLEGRVERLLDIPPLGSIDSNHTVDPNAAIVAEISATVCRDKLSFVPAVYQFSSHPLQGQHPTELSQLRLSNQPGLEFPDEERMVREFTGSFLTYHDFMELSLYDEDIGYYSSGKVQFGNQAHFSTWPNTASPEFGQLAVEQAFTMWQSMLTAGDIDENETFTILELGAGNGQLANDMLNAASRHSQQDRQWTKFYSILQYCIVERSPALQKVQKERLAKYSDKVIVQIGDARSIGLLPPKSLKGLVFTNELPDAFPVHRTCVQPDGAVLVQIVIPYLDFYNLYELETSYRIDVEALQAKSNALKQKFGAFLNNEFSDEIVISSQDLKNIIQTLDKYKVTTDRFFHCYTIGVPARFFPEVHDYCRRHQTSIDLLQPPTHMNVNLGMRSFIENIASILDKGFMTTIDYGHADRGWASPLAYGARVPRFYPKNTSDTQNICGCDITTDIPWTQFTREGAVHFNDPVLREQTALGNLSHPRWSESGDFKMHIQRVKGTQAFYRPPKGQDLPLV